MSSRLVKNTGQEYTDISRLQLQGKEKGERMIKERLMQLRAIMEREGLDAYLILTDDFHGSEYVGDYFKCRRFMSGFTGSAGTLVVTKDMAGLWTDGRYFLQAEEQLAGSSITLYRSGDEGVPTVTDFLADTLPENGRLGFDGRTVNYKMAFMMQEKMQAKNIHFSYEKDLVDEIWTKRPVLSAEPVMELDVCYAGKTRAEKIKEVREKMKEQKADCFVLTALDDIAWLLNIRGNDVTCNPVVLSYLAMTDDTLVLFINEKVLPEAVKSALAKDGVTFAPYNEVYAYVKKLPQGSSLLVDDGKTNYAIVKSCPSEVTLIKAANPTSMLKCVKNATEVENERKAHVKDGVAMTKLIYWLKHSVGKEEITELSVAEKLEELHREQENYMGPSFEPIIGFAEHGAIIHYSATEESSAKLAPRSFVLMDTGGQYLEGTTDITRTVALGPLTDEEKESYTMVLRGNLNLGGARFKEGVSGLNLDYLARFPMWERGLDYNHGTGHGVGYFLNVHEGPVSFHWRAGIPGRSADTVLKEGMIVSNEPGLYFAGKFGVRLENLITCIKSEKNEYGQFMSFETLTMVPFDLEAVVPEQLSEHERSLLNAYHAKVYETISPYLNEDEKAWLKQATREI